MSHRNGDRSRKIWAISQTQLGILGLIGILIFILFIQFLLLPRISAYTANFQPNETLHPEITGSPDPIIASMLLQVNKSEIYRTVSDLQDIPTRAYGTPGNREAAEYLSGRLSEYPNLSIEYQGGELRNIIATLPGQDQKATRIILVGAHYDSNSSDPAHAPGATDNGCGVAIVLELARVMGRYRFNDSLEFAFWNGEEGSGGVDLAGSKSYAGKARNQSLDIAFYLNYDSSCFDPENRSVVDVIFNVESRPFAEEMVMSNTLYRINATFTYNLFHCQDDQKPFWSAGYPAIMTHSESHAFQHTPEGTIDKASFGYAAMNARLGMAVMAQNAGRVEEG